MLKIKEIAKESIESCNRPNDWATIKNSVKNNVYRYIYDTTKRSPMIMPIIMEV